MCISIFDLINYIVSFDLKEFGKLINNWDPVVQVAAINCVEETNEEICRNYSIEAYPTVRLFWTNVNDQSDHGEHVKDLAFSAEFLRDAVIKFTLNNLKTKQAPVNWPVLNKQTISNQKEMNNNNQLTIANQPSVGIVEKNDSFVGQQVNF